MPRTTLSFNHRWVFRLTNRTHCRGRPRPFARPGMGILISGTIIPLQERALMPPGSLYPLSWCIPLPIIRPHLLRWPHLRDFHTRTSAHASPSGWWHIWGIPLSNAKHQTTWASEPTCRQGCIDALCIGWAWFFPSLGPWPIRCRSSRLPKGFSRVNPGRSDIFYGFTKHSSKQKESATIEFRTD